MSDAGADIRSQVRVLILLCTYNEVDNLPIAVERLFKQLPDAHILVVDDNSPDGTSDWVIQAGKTDPRLHLLRRSGKLGLGSAIREGIGWFCDHGYDYLINMDADLSHRPEDTPMLLDCCLQTGCDVAVASRYLSGGGFRGIPVHRRLISWLLNRYATMILRLPISDCSGSFRCYSRAALERLDLQQLTCNGYGFLEEILVQLHRSGCQFKEVPIWFDMRQAGKSKLSLKDALGALRVIHRLAFVRP